MLFDINMSETAWKIFQDQDYNIINSNEYVSLLESILETENKDLYGKYNVIKQSMRKIKRDSDVQLHYVDMKDYSHENRIMHNLDRVLFANTCDTGNIVNATIDLNENQLFVLMCAVVVHDYGKTRWKLGIHSLLREVSIKTDSNILYKDLLEQLNDESSQVNQNEEIAQLRYCFRELWRNYNGVELNIMNEEGVKCLEYYHTYNIFHYIDAVIDSKNGNDKGSHFILNDAIVFPADPKREDCTLFNYLKNINEEHLKQIKVIASAHKAFKHCGRKSSDKFFDECINDKILCSLLRLADNLDMDCNRVIRLEDRTLTGELYDWFNNRVTVLTPKIVQTFAVWTKYLLIKKVDIQHESDSNECFSLNIIINYYRFPHADKYFFPLRYLAEKDFFDTKYLDVICANMKVKGSNRINLMYRILDEVSGYSNIDIKGDIANIFDQAIPAENRGATANEPGLKGLFHVLADIENSHMPFHSEVFTEAEKSGFKLHIPRKFMLYRFLNYFKDADIISTTEFKKYFGITTDEGVLEHEYVQRELLVKGSRDDSYRLSVDTKNIITSLKLVAKHNPIVIKSKIDEVQQFKKPMPFSRYEGSSNIITGIPGTEEIIFNSSSLVKGRGAQNISTLASSIKGGELKHSRNIIIKGGPGTGKTTTAIQIMVSNSTDQSKYAGKQVVYISFEENPSRLELECRENFGWCINQQRIMQFKMCEYRFQSAPTDAQAFARTFFDIIVGDFHSDIIFIDSLNRLHDFIKKLEIKYPNSVIRQIFDMVELWHMTAFYLLEDDDDNMFEEYAADGIIYLENISGKRTIEFKKLRNQRVIPGKHSFKIIDKTQFDNSCMLEKKWLLPGVNVFPNIRTYTEKVHRQSGYQEAQRVTTGIDGLDMLLPVNPQDPNDHGGFLKKNIVLVMGSPGSGKTIFGLHFAKKGIEGEKEKEEKESCLWVSFEGGKEDLKFTVVRFHPSLKFNELFDPMDEKSSRFMFQYFPPAYFNQDELIYAIVKIIENTAPRKISRLVIDSVSELESLFDEESKFKNFMAVMMYELRKMDITTIFLYRTSVFFGYQNQTKTIISSLVDTIISIKTFDIKNRIKKGLFVLKSRGREHKSNLHAMEIIHDKGIVVSDKGWEYEGLLSGETGEIKEPCIFLKLFYENPAEQSINNYLISEFGKRYPKEYFTCVQKSHIYSEFWSFKGNYGAGHANIRIVSLNKYMVEAFRENDRLHKLDGFFSSSLREEIKSDTRWNKFFNNDGHFDFLPSYCDYGVLVIQKLNIKGVEINTDIQKISWEELFERLISIKKMIGEASQGTSDNMKYYPFAMPPLDDMVEFVAFFMEILWSLNGDIFRFPPFSEKQGKDGSTTINRLLFYKHLILKDSKIREEAQNISNSLKNKDKVTHEAMERTLTAYCNVYLTSEDTNALRINDSTAHQALSFLCDVVNNGYCPNPAKGDFRSHAITSRNWYSRVGELTSHMHAIKSGNEIEYIRQRNSKKKISHRIFKQDCEPNVELDHLPYFESTGKSVANQGVWCLSIIKEALSPEIGWIFIDSLISPEIRKMRSSEHLGFPIKIDDMKSETYYWSDPIIYSKITSIMESDSKIDLKYQHIGILRNLNTELDKFNDIIAEIIKTNESGSELSRCLYEEINPVVIKLMTDLEYMLDGKKNPFLKILSCLEKSDQAAVAAEKSQLYVDGFTPKDSQDGIVTGKTLGYLIVGLIKKVDHCSNVTTPYKERFKQIMQSISREALKEYVEHEKELLLDKIKKLLENFFNFKFTDVSFETANVYLEQFKHNEFDKHFYLSQPKKTTSEVVYCSNIVANRPYFYRLEPIIHTQIKRLFTENGDVLDKNKIPEILRDMRQQIIIEIFSNPGI